MIAGIAALWFVRVDDVYVAGSITEGDTQKAVYWKNGKVFPLPVEAQRSSAQSIYVSGKDAIVAGIEFENIPGYESELPFGKYWKNGVKHGLKFSDGYGYLMENAALCVSGGNVYQTGWADGTNGPIAYSKNGEVTAYVTASIGSVHSIAVEGADIYLAGFIDRSAVNNWLNDKDTGSQSSNIEPLYWKNGDDVVFLSPGKLGMVNAIQVSNSDVYTAGFIMVDGEAKATYWKNDNETVLSSDGQSISSGQSLFVAGQDIYVAGQRSAGENKEAVYWKNNQATVLGNGSSAVAASIFVLDSDVYVCGSTSNQSTGIMIACYWKNGKIKYLDNGASASADAIFVVNKPLWERLLGK
ncbi:hypothetical protein FACS189493_6260 [Spirochaetia bacterium]|nr:hypothetical protein FACS189493_6260 [Spirochaetia bacterium]